MSAYVTNKTLIFRVKNKNDESSWNEFTENYRGYIHAVIRNMGVHQSEIEDLTQKTLLILWEKLPSFIYSSEKCKFRSWISKIIRNIVIKHFNKQKRIKNDVTRASLQSINNGDDEYLSPEIYKVAEKEWKYHIAKLAWENIRDEFGGKVIECFQLFMNGKNVDEVCDELDIKKNSAFVFRKRVQDRFSKEIRRLDYDLS
ncbi:MAG: RNA polymerase sigma factor [Lentisphaeraceae bacterium]|nr:RNA polymerase sigma factor [Lentisphaeraceae bacterium]